MAERNLVAELLGDYKDSGGFAMREYEVTGTHRVFEQRPGTRFRRRIPEAQEARLLASGAIRRVPAERGNTGNDDPLPKGVEDLGGGWFLLPDGETKVQGRDALAAALAE